MAQRPSNPSPYLTSVDANSPIGIELSCLINNQDIISGYKLYIIDNNVEAKTDSEGKSYIDKVCQIEHTQGNEPIVQKITYTITEAGSIETTAEPMELLSYPQLPIVGGAGEESYLKVTIPSSVLTNGNDYKWYIELTDNMGKTVTSPEYYFKARSVPTIEIISEDIEGGILPYCNGIFSGAYTQNDVLETGEVISVALRSHRWELYTQTNSDGDYDKLVYATDETYSHNIKFEYNGFMSGLSYKIALIVTTEDGVTVETYETFTVEYKLMEPFILPIATVNKKQNAVEVDYSGTKTIIGKLTETSEYNFTEDGVHLEKGATLYWDEITGEEGGLQIDNQSFTLFTYINLGYDFSGTVLSLEGDSGEQCTISYNEGIFYWSINGKEGEHIAYDATYPICISSDTTDLKTYKYELDESATYSFTDDYQYVFYDVGYEHWWKITITPDEVYITRAKERDENV